MISFLDMQEETVFLEMGSDFIDGGDDGAAQFGWVPKDMAVYAGASKNYTITTYTKTDSVYKFNE